MALQPGLKPRLWCQKRAAALGTEARVAPGPMSELPAAAPQAEFPLALAPKAVKVTEPLEMEQELAESLKPRPA